MHILTRLCAVALAVGATACGPSIEITKALEVTDVTTGWFDAGITNGMNKLVPSLTFKARNVSNIQVESVQFNAVFRVVDDPQELGSALVKGIDRHGIAPGASTPIYTMQSALGYTGQQPRSEMLAHKDFHDVRVDLYAKYRSDNWVKVGSYLIQRKLLTSAPPAPAPAPAPAPGPGGASN
ncbi:MAG: hypothetical protein JNM38_24380 [Acidobacteria bacterium]|jgi:hypothetical protein|nr:hypothetical protein [Acidobacteriota bacterium]